ncbi:YciI family protein [Sandaracinobacteroides saxicola]|uniref:YciI family protein n=1 Tax=Sandaracinobacteroides saxicola TaxID=2759707 RepID=A0A7G5IGP5_9SPHN|nr:YciI family protein [Sandaracinobacteroides saxicola]QMW22537.1 YciI family protein [Sandaracinobacteroides saxicola]
MYMVICQDDGGSAAVTQRATLLQAHLAHVEANMAHYAVAGPLLDEAGRVTGSLLILDVATLAEAEAVMAGDPYSHAPIWRSVTYARFRGVAGNWVGGAAWKRA